MRLTCPNCAAQYEIDASLIPIDGREVQCANCSHTWFARRDPAAAERPARAEKEADTSKAEPPSPPLPDTRAEEEPEGVDPESGSGPEDAAAVPRRRELDPRTRSILEEEAALEAEQRRRDASKPADPEPAPRRDVPPAPPERARATHRSTPTVPMAANDTDPLPDRDRIGATLDTAPAHTEKPTVPPVTDGATPRGFVAGFALVIAIAALFVLVYVEASTLAAAFPEIEGSLAAYVDRVNALRAGFDGWIGNLAGRI
ncbi:MJ0042-type zinc finger domain-containing protein [Palleronia sp. LCG004]|uniref:zinc-ribbon domain-containing protein n=1 Tax=Palleronia sp. LCG004 TaxID=3079304 RepID=UPI0029435C08|nr:MJ0042-type zinc finger domain-containing protein [Palleronia sp. LCG004]WOI55392.1 zinc-ribbon domain-containing protein [Palleronia sp. LCG004]